MNDRRTLGGLQGTVWTIGILGTFLLVAGLVWVMRLYTVPAPIGADRIAERYKFLREVRAAEADALNNYAVLDPAKGVVRIPIARAMELTIQEWKNPEAARKELIARMEKATAVPPPPPEKPSIYE